MRKREIKINLNSIHQNSSLEVCAQASPVFHQFDLDPLPPMTVASFMYDPKYFVKWILILNQMANT